MSSGPSSPEGDLPTPTLPIGGCQDTAAGYPNRRILDPERGEHTLITGDIFSWIHYLDALSGCIIWIHYLDALSGCIIWKHYLDALSGCIIWTQYLDAVSGCIHYLDAFTVWMHSLSGCIHCLDAFTVWMHSLSGCIHCLDTRVCRIMSFPPDTSMCFSFPPEWYMVEHALAAMV